MSNIDPITLSVIQAGLQQALVLEQRQKFQNVTVGATAHRSWIELNQLVQYKLQKSRIHPFVSLTPLA